MAWHLYIVPIVGSGTQVDPRMPKYFATLGVKWAMIDYGFQPIGLVAADVDAATDASLQSNSDLTKIPDNLDNQVGSGGALTTVQNALESRNLPGQWVQATTTFRTIIRLVIAACFLLQRYSFVANSAAAVMSGAVNLSSTFDSLPLGVRQKLVQAASALNINTSGFTGSSTLRQILKGVADQWASVQRQLGGVMI